MEKEALLIVGEALAALGDPHAVLAFASAGPSRVVVQDAQAVRRGAGTSAGAPAHRGTGARRIHPRRRGHPARHRRVSTRQAARHRLLLLLSDGRPNDVDQYEGRYGVEDTRAAVAEARLQGVHVHCLTVDREAPRYATRDLRAGLRGALAGGAAAGVLTAVLRDLVTG